mgnify:CR=1 FL=1
MLQTLSLAGQEYVVIAKSDYETLASRVSDDDERFPADFVNKLFDSDNRIGVWREYRGLTMSALKPPVSRSLICPTLKTAKRTALSRC